MAETVIHPLASAAQRALDKADSLPERNRARWLPDEHCWLVPSSREGEPAKRVVRRQPASNVTDETGHVASKHTGYGWAFVLDCDCEASQKGYVLCWHKAAVFRWWQQYRRVDGDPYADLDAHSPAAAHANAAVDTEGVEWRKDREPNNVPDDDARAPDRGPNGVYYDADADGTLYRVDPDAPDYSLDAPVARFYDGVDEDDGPMSSGTCDDLPRVQP